MKLLGEVSLTPQIFLRASYQDDEGARQAVRTLYHVLLRDVLTRNLADGAWERFLDRLGPSLMHLKAKELYRKLKQENRLSYAPGAVQGSDGSHEFERSWLVAVRETATEDPCLGTVVSPAIQDLLRGEARVDRLPDTEWWNEICRTTTARIERPVESYLDHFRPVLRGARSVMFIDPYIDPEVDHYRSVLELILACRPGRDTRIELHRVRYRGSGPCREMQVDWEPAFGEWSRRCREKGVRVHVFIRSEFHDRYLITDQIGLGLSNGLDLSRPGDRMLVSKLDRPTVDELRSEYSENSPRPKTALSFTIGV